VSGPVRAATVPGAGPSPGASRTACRMLMPAALQTHNKPLPATPRQHRRPIQPMPWGDKALPTEGPAGTPPADPPGRRSVRRLPCAVCPSRRAALTS